MPFAPECGQTLILNFFSPKPAPALLRNKSNDIYSILQRLHESASGIWSVWFIWFIWFVSLIWFIPLIEFFESKGRPQLGIWCCGERQKMSEVGG